MKIIVTAGGTGGHIYPALSIINKLKENKSNKFLYIGTKDRMENELIPSLNIPYKSIEIYGLTKNMVKNVKNIKCIFKSYRECLKIIEEFKPDAVIAFGGYVSFPVIMAAKKLKVKTYLHEQNVIPGKANKFLGRFADKIFISFEDSKKYFNPKKTMYSGNPCLEEATKILKADKSKLGLDKNKKLIIIVMGSLGSSVVNEKLLEFLRNYEENDKEIVFITGKKNFDILGNNLIVPKSTHVIPYFDNLSSLMKAADLIISRAGATTLSEIIAVNIPSILIPSPYVPNNHQYYNALDMVNKKVSIMIEQDKLNKESITEAINSILNDKKNNLDIINRLKKIEKIKSSTIIYEEIKKEINK